MTTSTTLPFAGGELSSFDPLDTNCIENTGGGFDPDWARCALGVLSGSNGGKSPTWPVESDFWWHGRLGVDANNTWFGTVNGLDLYDSGVIVACIRLSTAVAATSSRHELFTLQSGVLTSVGFINLLGGVQALDVHIVAGASGSASFYSGGTLIFSASGLNHSGFSGVDQIRLGGGYSLSFFNLWSEIICDNVPHIGDRLYTYPEDTGSAINTGWSGSVSDVDEIITSDASAVTAASAGLISTYYASAADFGTYNVQAVCIGVRAQKSATGPTSLAVALRVHGTNYFGPTIALDVGFQACCASWTDDPFTASPWAPANAALAEAGMQSIA